MECLCALTKEEEMKINFHLAVRLILISLLFDLMGCTPAATEVPVPPSVTVVIPTETLIPTNASIPTETLIPTASSTPFVPKATIKIASQSPLSVQYADLGTGVMHGAELAVRQLADPLMELGYKAELASYDDQNNFGVAADIAKQIVADPQILCLVGPFTSRVLNQVKEIYHQAGLAFVSPSTTAAFVAGSGYPEVNRLVGRNDGEGVAGAQFAKAQGFARVFIISQNTDPTTFIAKYFRNEASQLGITVVGNMSTDIVKNFGSLIDRAISNNADLIYFSTLSVEQAGNFFREVRTAGYKGAFMGPSSLDTPSLLEFAGPLLTEVGGTYYTNVVLPASGYPDAANFIEDFETLYDVTPQMFAAQAYDAVGVCMKAIEEASKTKGGEIPTRVEVAKAIRALQNFEGITGVYNFDKYGDPNPAKYFVFQVVSADPNAWKRNTLIATFEIAPPQ
jgi:branched-chain amino acid transport system substrate-binding protein